MEAEKRKDHHDDDDQTDEVNYSVHGKSPGRVGEASFSLSTRTAVPPFRTSVHLGGRVGKQTFVLQCTFDLKMSQAGTLLDPCHLR
jgi:hypothetical protein